MTYTIYFYCCDQVIFFLFAQSHMLTETAVLPKSFLLYIEQFNYKLSASAFTLLFRYNIMHNAFKRQHIKASKVVNDTFVLIYEIRH